MTRSPPQQTKRNKTHEIDGKTDVTILNVKAYDLKQLLTTKFETSLTNSKKLDSRIRIASI